MKKNDKLYIELSFWINIQRPYVCIFLCMHIYIYICVRM